MVGICLKYIILGHYLLYGWAEQLRTTREEKHVAGFIVENSTNHMCNVLHCILFSALVRYPAGFSLCGTRVELV